MSDERFMRHHYGASGYVAPSADLPKTKKLMDLIAGEEIGEELSK